MRVGLLHLFECPIGKSEKEMIDENLEMIQAADELGFDSVWAAEHHFSIYGVMPTPAVYATAAAMKTKRVRIGVAVVVLPFHNPIRVAEDFAFVDILSNGRLEFGVGRGSQPSEYAGFGISQEDSRARFREYLNFILKAWTEEAVTFEGRYVQARDMTVRPKPLQKPHPPVWVAAVSPQTFPSVGSWGFNLLFAPPWKASTTALDAYRKALVLGGHDPARVRVAALVHLFVDEDAERARRVFQEPLMWYYRVFSGLVSVQAGQAVPRTYEHYAKLRDLTQTISYEQLLQVDGVIVGDPETCLRKIRRLQETYGLTDLLCWTRLGGLDHREVVRSMELTARHILPRVRPLEPSRGFLEASARAGEPALLAEAQKGSIGF